jgi:hypothetical protein
MTKLKKTIAAIAALGSLALGGAVLAQAQSGSAPQVQSAPAKVKSAPAKAEPTGGPDTDTVQSGDQTTPDQPGAASGSEQQSSEGPDQPGSESGGESADQSDGPGGHADPAGNVDNQFEGQQ